MNCPIESNTEALHTTTLLIYIYIYIYIYYIYIYIEGRETLPVN